MIYNQQYNDYTFNLYYFKINIKDIVYASTYSNQSNLNVINRYIYNIDIFN